MTPTLIALALLVVAVAVVAWLTHRRTQPDAAPRIDSDQDTAWNDPVTPAPHHEPRPRP